MKRLLVTFLSCVTLTASFQVLAQSDTVSHFTQRFDAFMSVLREPLDKAYPSSKVQARAIQAAYDKNLASIECGTQKLTDAQVRDLYRAANEAEFYTHRSKYLAVMKQCLDQLVKRGHARPFDYTDLYGGFVQARLWRKARTLAATYPDVEFAALPEIVDHTYKAASTPTALFVAIDDSKLTREPIDTHGFHLIVVAHPLCHFSQRAIRAIEKDPQLKALFKRYADLVTPPARSLEFSTLRKWNLEHPTNQMSIAYSMKEWSLVDYWGTPTFYFTRDGKVLKRIVGWPDPEQAGKLLDAFHKFAPKSEQNKKDE